MWSGERTEERLMQWGLGEMRRHGLGSGTLVPCDTASETVLFLVVLRTIQNVLNIILLSSFWLLAALKREP